MYLIIFTYNLKLFEEIIKDSLKYSIYDLIEHTIIRIEDNEKNIIPILNKTLTNEKIKNIILSSNIGFIQNLMRVRMKCMHYPPDSDPDPYIKLCLKIIKADHIPSIGYIRNPMKNSAGVIPVIYHEGKLFFALGLDKIRKKYSDFGGGFDEKYTKHQKKDSFKNLILQDKQILNGNIDVQILVDHCMGSENIKKIATKLKNDKNKCHLAYGDPNSKYTAFRELMEESSSNNQESELSEILIKSKNDTSSGIIDEYKNDAIISHKSNITYVFDPSMVYKKLYEKREYVYLGGDRLYGYDLFLLFVTPEDLDERSKKGFLELYELYENNPEKYIKDKGESITENVRIKIPENSEMYGIEILPMVQIVNAVKHIDYAKYAYDKQLNEGEYKWYNLKEDQNIQKNISITYHADKYKSNILDLMRPCFAEALIKYNKELDFVMNYFEDIKQIFSL